MKEEILRLLRSADGYISGQELCNRFGVSRTAVWKAINQLKEAGYEIEAQQNKGYRLMAAPDLMTEAEIKSLMHTEWVAKEVLYFDTIDSTNTKAQELAEKGYPSGTLVVADKQESGKGRRGRSWVSPSGTGKTFSSSTRVRWLEMLLAPERMASRRILPVIIERCSSFSFQSSIISSTKTSMRATFRPVACSTSSLTRWVMLWVMDEMFSPYPTLMCSVMTRWPSC